LDADLDALADCFPDREGSEELPKAFLRMSVRAESEHNLIKEKKDDKSSTLMLAVALSLPMPPVPPVTSTVLPAIGPLGICSILVRLCRCWNQSTFCN